MIPTLFHLGPFPVHSFGLMVALAMIAAMTRAGMSFRNNGLPAEIGRSYAFIGTITGLVGARVWFALENYHLLVKDPLSVLLSSAGFTFYGGFIVSFVVIVALSRKDRIPFATLADSVGPCLCLCYVVGRLGCQLSGDGDYGIPTGSWFGMSYAAGVIPTPPGVSVYPTPLFESAFGAAILVALVRAENHGWWQVPFRRAALYFVTLSLERFSVEALRATPIAFNLPYNLGGLSQAQCIALGLGLFGVLLGIAGSRKRHHP